ncbi:glycosyltransferase [Pengzhenrongella sicca]|uniref:Glycosyltransferase n=1 Tax=Pengzhenrongella sicca TaxID=2819238 RepID=A0A8A4ZHB1_9MICO|nr:glycosyltransferase [Pengzhenrongella sicca]QTE29028.1 glycosyltransferase [Pengzhenrongella sicca]
MHPSAGSANHGAAAHRPRREVLAFARAFEPGHRAGGPIQSMNHVFGVVGAEVRITLVTRDRDLGDRAPYPGLSGRLVPRGRHAVFYWDRTNLRQTLALVRMLRPTRFDLLYVNSFWDPWFTLAPLAAAQLRVVRARRLLLAPRGELAPGALAIKPRKKRVTLPLIAPFVARLPVVWQAQSPHEVSDIHRVFPQARIIKRADSAAPDPVNGVRASERIARFVFISRISPIKNLAVAIEALRALDGPAIFDIFGPVSDPAYWRRCQALLRTVPESVVVTYRGELPHDAVQATFADYDAFVLPSSGEGFGHAIAESLSAGCPVLCSERTLWTQVLRSGGGAALPDLEPQTWGTELARIAALTGAERSHRKADALAAYLRWRAATDRTTAVDEALRLADGPRAEGVGR